MANKSSIFDSVVMWLENGGTLFYVVLKIICGFFEHFKHDPAQDVHGREYGMDSNVHGYGMRPP